jgi:hypothetical protein
LNGQEKWRITPNMKVFADRWLSVLQRRRARYKKFLIRKRSKIEAPIDICAGYRR